MTLDDEIDNLRAELRRLKEEEERKLEDLHKLFLQRAEKSCPIPLGAKVEYQPGRFGQVDRIEYWVDFLNELKSGVEVYWAVSGRKINKSGEFGVKDFHQVGPATHYVNGTCFVHKGPEGIFDMTVPDDD